MLSSHPQLGSRNKMSLILNKLLVANRVRGFESRNWLQLRPKEPQRLISEIQQNSSAIEQNNIKGQCQDAS